MPLHQDDITPADVAKAAAQWKKDTTPPLKNLLEAEVKDA